MVDLHALTVEHDPARVRRLSRQAATLLLAAGLDPGVCTVFVQSHVDEHARLSYLLECVGHGRRDAADDPVQGEGRAGAGARGQCAAVAADVSRADGGGHPGVRDDEVPVGDDQAQHVELARDLAVRFNQRYGHTFVVPKATLPPVAARVMNLQEPASKMGKRDDFGAGIVYLLDEPEVVRKKVMRAVTDRGGRSCTTGQGRPGVANLLEILAACTGGEPEALAEEYDVVRGSEEGHRGRGGGGLRPLRARHPELCADPGYVERVLRDGAERARDMARPVVDAAYRAIGLLPP